MIEEQELLRACQSRIFRDIWRITDPEIVLQMYYKLEKGMGTALSMDTPKLNLAADLLRWSPSPLEELNFMVHSAKNDVVLYRWAKEHNARAEAIRAAKEKEGGQDD